MYFACVRYPRASDATSRRAMNAWPIITAATKKQGFINSKSGRQSKDMNIYEHEISMQDAPPPPQYVIHTYLFEVNVFQ